MPCFQSLIKPVFLPCLLVTTSLLSNAQTPSDPTAFRGDPFIATVADLRAASSAMPPDHEYEAQILLEEGTYRVAPDGSHIYQYRLIFRVDSTQGVNDWSEVSMQWDPWNEKPAQLHARVLQADGHFAELDQKTITDAPVKGDDTETYSSEHVRRAPLPGMAVGSIVEEVRTVEEKTPYFAAGSLFRFQFRNGVPTAHTRAIFETPSAIPFKELVHNLPQLAITRTEANGKRLVIYEQGHMDASHASDIDLSTDNPDLPSVEVATGESWGALVNAYSVMANPQIIPDDTRSILPTDLPTARMDRIAAIVAQLHKQVRYTGVEFGAAKLTPERPAEVIKRHYGDCKDKAALLVAMLRAVNIPASLALLSTGPGRDVDPAMPGMSQFDHAIVYVHADGSDPALWIDATAQYFTPGSLPFEDEGRMALIIAPDTTGLTRTKDPKPEDSLLVETRLFTLAPHGPSHVVESSQTSGIVDANYRAWYGGQDSKKVHENLEGYIKSAYLAKKLSSVTHGAVDDVSTPFNLTLDIDKASRGNTTLDEAIVVIFPTMTLNNLPGWFGKAPEAVGPDTTPDAKHEIELAAANRSKTYVFRPYLDERHIRIVIPPGFVSRTLPPNKTTQLGQATLTEEYSAEEKGIITATYKFNTGPGTLTADQAIAMRDAILELQKRDYVGIMFDQVGAKELAAGHIRASLDADRALIAAQPTEALPHVQIARALLAAGIGDEAHTEAKRATELDPKLAIAFNTLGWTLQHDSLGARFGKDFDLPGAIAAYKQAIVLDPEDNDSRFDLAILYEFNARGTRYAEDADMASAIASYKELIERTKESNPAAAAQYRDNLFYALLFTHKYTELDGMLATAPFSNAHASLAIASATAQHGAAAGIAQSEKGNVEGSDRNKNLNAAGALLAQLRLYPEASAILQAGIGSGGDAATTARQIEMYKNMKPASLAPLAATDPAAPMQRVTLAMMAGTLTSQMEIDAISHHAYSSQASMERDAQKGLQNTGLLRMESEKSGVSETVLLDIIAGNMTFTSTGDNDSGYALVMTTPGSEGGHVYVVREDGAYHVVADAGDNTEVGNEVLYALEHKQLKLAKALLDWKRDLTHKGGGDDPFAGPLFPRFWTVDSTKPDADSPEAMRLAAISLLAGSMDAKPYLPEIAAAREKATGQQRQTDLDLLLASAANGAEQPALALPAAKRLMETEPDSQAAVGMASFAYALQSNSADWLAMLAPRIAKRPKDRELLLEQVSAYESAKNFTAARAAQQAVLDSGKATASDYNSFAWMGLFDDHIGEPELKAAQKANLLTNNGNFASLHTLACVYAAEGRTTEARQVLKQAMDAANESAPNSAVWYVLGMIYEQYGARNAALTAYNKVHAHEFDDHTYINPTDTYLLAQMRIKALNTLAK
jgi:tetratricopeptide (TPR) repeat protein